MATPFASLDELPAPPAPKYTPLDQLPDPADDFVAKRPVSIWERPITAIAQGAGRLLAEEPSGLQVSPQEEPQYKPVLTGAGEAFLQGGRKLTQALLAGPALVEAVGRRFVGPAPTASDPTFLGNYLEMQRRQQEADAAAASYDQRPGVAGFGQEVLDASAGSVPMMAPALAAGALAPVSRVAGPAAQALARAVESAKAAGIGTFTQEAQDNPTPRGLVNAGAQGILEGVFTKLGGATGIQALFKQGGPEGVHQGVTAALRELGKETGKEAGEEGGTGLSQEIARQLIIDGQIDPRQAAHAGLVSMGAGAAMGGAANLPGTVGEIVNGPAREREARRAALLAELDATLPGEGADPSQRLRAPLAGGGLDPSTAEALAAVDTMPRVPVDLGQFTPPESITYDGTPATIAMDPVQVAQGGDTLDAQGPTVGQFTDPGDTEGTRPDVGMSFGNQRLRDRLTRMGEAGARMDDLRQQEQGEPNVATQQVPAVDPAAETQQVAPVQAKPEGTDTLATEAVDIPAAQALAQQMRTPQEQAAEAARKRRERLPADAAVEGDNALAEQGQAEAGAHLDQMREDAPRRREALAKDIPATEERLRQVTAELADAAGTFGNSSELRRERLNRHHAELQGGVRLTEGGDGVENADGTVRSFDKGLAATGDYQKELRLRLGWDRSQAKTDRRKAKARISALRAERQKLTQDLARMKAEGKDLEQMGRRGAKIESARLRAPQAPAPRPGQALEAEAAARNDQIKAGITTPDRNSQERAEAIAAVMLREKSALRALDRLAPIGDPDRDAALVSFRRQMPRPELPQRELPTTQQALATEEADGAAQVDQAQAMPESFPNRTPEPAKSGTIPEQSGTNSGTPIATGTKGAAPAAQAKPKKEPTLPGAPKQFGPVVDPEERAATAASRAEMDAARPAIDQVAKASGLEVRDRSDHFVLVTKNGAEVPIYLKGAVAPDAINWASWHNTFLARYRGNLEAARAEFRRITGGTLPPLAGELPGWAKRNPVKVQALVEAGLVPKGSYQGGTSPRITLIEAKGKTLPDLVETVAHEHGHWAADRFLTDPERQTLLDGLPGMQGASIDPAAGSAYGQFLEAVQSALEAHAKAKAQGGTAAQQKQREAVKPAAARVIERLWQQLYNLFRGFRSAPLPKGANIATERVLEALRSGEVFNRAGSSTVKDSLTVAGNAVEVANIGKADTIDVDGTTRPRLNSNGKPIAGTDDAVRAFWRWFGDSKVVDDQGRPLVVYHGTDENIDSFNDNTFFAYDPDISKLYGKNISEVYVRSNRVLSANSADDVIKALEADEYAGQNEVKAFKRFSGDHTQELLWNASQNSSSIKLQSGLMALATEYDAIKFTDDSFERGQGSVPHKSLFVLNAGSNVKSATGNRGTFDSGNPDIRYSMDMSRDRMPESEQQTQEEESQPEPKSPVQRLQDATPGQDPETFAQWQQEATELLASERRRGELLRDAARGMAVGPAGEIALRRMAAEALAEATRTGSAPAWDKVGQIAEARKAAGTSAARELAARRLDLSTPEGRQELILSFATEMGPKWSKEMKRARSEKGRADVRRRWQQQVQKITRTMRKKYGIDLTDPDLGATFGDVYSLGHLMDRMSDAGKEPSLSDPLGSGHSWTNLLGYYTVGNLLSLGSFAVNLTGYPIMGAIGLGKGLGRAALAASKAGGGERSMAALLGPAQAARFAASSMLKGLTNGVAAVLTGHGQAEKAARVFSDYQEQDRGSSPGRGIGRAVAVGFAPFLEINRAVDEIAWTMAYSGALAMEASQAKAAGDPRTVEQIHAEPSAEMIERAALGADWFTLKGKPESEMGRKIHGAIQTGRKIDLIEEHTGLPIPNPGFFVLPFFNAIANLTTEGLKISPAGIITQAALAAKRARDGATAESPSERQASQEKAVRSLVYTLIGTALAGLVWGASDDEGKDAITGAGDTGKTAGEREVIDRTQKPRTAWGVDYSRWDPIGLPAAMHADLRDAIRDLKAGKPAGQVLNKLGEKAWKAAIDRQFLSGIHNVLDRQFNKDGEEKTVGEKIVDQGKNMLDPGRQYLSSYRVATETTAQKGGAGVVTALAGDQRMPAFNLFGENEQVEGGLVRGKRREPSAKAQGWYDLLAKSNKASEGRDWNPQPPTSVISLGKRQIRLDPQQRNELAKLTGQEYLRLLGDPARYQTKDPEQVLAWMKNARETASKRARGQFIAANPGVLKP